ncbi:MAG: hypothetical protein ACLFMM_08445 [Methanohalobium sp.]|uniref:hypothetical protein n=1 Tax=Methanohalobium sp. TaxID=2837493 RepID=UPI00397AB30B
MDLGVNNVITMVNNIGKKPIVVKGGIVKSINQYFNLDNRIQSGLEARLWNRKKRTIKNSCRFHFSN